MMTPFESAVRGSLEESRGGRTHVHYRNDLGDRATPLSGTQLMAGAAAPRESLEEENRRLRRELAETRRANEILKKASAFFAAELDRPTTR